MLGTKIQSAAEDKNGNSEVLKRPVFSTNGLNCLNYSVDSLGFGIGLFVVRGIAKPIKVLPKHLCNLDHFLRYRFVHTGEQSSK